ncbi:transcriptional regulator [Halobacillus salinus]|uniref:transcriptional regulator n=1 Tax=Halobacillus salinus TaxID=192814 RepID=UPI0009A8F082|nr:transcriptional regulator [Halobacillus salinus]
MQRAKLRKTTFKHIEAEWFNYHYTLREITNLREEIANPFDEESEDINIVKGANSVSNPGNPTERITIRLTTNKRLAHLEKVAKSIEEVYNAIPDNYKELARLRYWNKRDDLNWDGLALELHISKRQAMRWRDDIIQATSEVLGWR